ncbi:M67 family metallopeptidase [Sphingomonas sp. RS6]
MQKAAAAAMPNEACGLLFGDAGTIASFREAWNVAETPTNRFEIDPAALFAALRAERAGGSGLIGYWHSHPNGDSTPSATDAAMAAPDGRLWVIVGDGAVTCWRAGVVGLWDRFEAVSLITV